MAPRTIFWSIPSPLEKEGESGKKGKRGWNVGELGKKVVEIGKRGWKVDEIGKKRVISGWNRKKEGEKWVK